VISGLSFTDTVDINQATIEQGEPIADASQLGRTIWYSFTPTAAAVLTTAYPYSPPDPNVFPTLCSLRGAALFLVIYRADGPGFAGLTQIAGSQSSYSLANTLNVYAGSTYYLQGGQNGQLTDPDCPPFKLSVNVAPMGAAEQLAALATAVTGIGSGTSLADKVQQTKTYVASNDAARACPAMTGFLNEVRAQTGKKLTSAQALSFTTQAQSIRTALGC
jgi:hypothetical protein